MLLQIDLVSYENHGDMVLVLDPAYLLMEGGDLVEALTGCDGVDEKETLAGAHVLLAHSRVLFLSGRVEDVKESNCAVDNALLSVGICTPC